MKRFQKAFQEIDFLKSADGKTIESYIQVYPFHPRTEKYFVQTAENKLLRLYINQYGLQLSSAAVLLNADKIEFVEQLFLKHRDNPEMVRFILNKASYLTARYLVQRYEIPELKEQKALLNKDEKKLLNQIKIGKISPYAVCDIFMRFDEMLQQAVIAMGKTFEPREFWIVVTKGSALVLQHLMDKTTKAKRFNVIHEFYLIRFGKRSELLRYLAQRRLHKLSEEFYYQAASFADLKAYVRRYKPEDGDMALLKSPDRSEILTWLSKLDRPLSWEAETELIKNGHHQEIKAYIKSHYLFPENEVRLIKRCKHREIILYLSHHTLSAEAQLELIYRGNASELFIMVTSCVLSDAAEELLKKEGPSCVWQVYNGMDVCEA